MPTYGFLLVKYLFFKGTLGSMLLKDSLCFVFLFTAIIPFLSIGILYKFKKISSLTLDKPSDRQLPYLITLLSYIVLVIYFVTPINPFSQYMFVAIVCLMLVMLINIVWKISAHMTAIGGLIAGRSATFGMRNNCVPFPRYPSVRRITGVMCSKASFAALYAQ